MRQIHETRHVEVIGNGILRRCFSVHTKKTVVMAAILIICRDNGRKVRIADHELKQGRLIQIPGIEVWYPCPGRDEHGYSGTRGKAIAVFNCERKGFPIAMATLGVNVCYLEEAYAKAKFGELIENPISHVFSKYSLLVTDRILAVCDQWNPAQPLEDRILDLVSAESQPDRRESAIFRSTTKVAACPDSQGNFDDFTVNIFVTERRGILGIDRALP